MEMEGESKKRKMTDEEEEEDDEELKMERFFALIRSAKDIRDQLIDSGQPSPRQKEIKKPAPALTKAKEDQTKGKTAVWKPRIEPKDFSFASKNEISRIDLDLNHTITQQGSEDQENHKADHNDYNNNNKNHFQAGRSRISFDLNLFPASVADVESADYTM